ICASDAHAHAVAEAFGAPVLRVAVAGDGLNVEADFDPAAVGARVGGWEVTEDAAADVVAFRLHGDGLGDREIAVALDRDVADEIEDALDGAGGANRRQDEGERNRDSREHAHGRTPGNATCGATAWARSSSSKNGSSRKPSGRASRTLGNDWMPMLRLRTAPL